MPLESLTYSHMIDLALLVLRPLLFFDPFSLHLRSNTVLFIVVSPNPALLSLLRDVPKALTCISTVSNQATLSGTQACHF